MAIWGYLRFTKSSPNAQKVFKRIRRIRGKNLCVHGEDAKRLLAYSPYTPVYISVNNNTNLNLFKILSNYIIWDRLSQKTISRYCPFDTDFWLWRHAWDLWPPLLSSLSRGHFSILTIDRLLMKITCLIPVTFPPSFLSSFYSILFCSIIFYSVIFYIFYDQGMLVTMDLDSCSLSIQRSILYSQVWKTKTSLRSMTSILLLILPRDRLSTYFRWSVDDQNMLETSDLHSCPPSVQRPVISAPFYNRSRMSLNNFFFHLTAYILYSPIF